MNWKPSQRFKTLIESGILISLIGGASVFAVVAYKVDAHAEQIAQLKQTNYELSKNIIEIQKEMLVRLTEIEIELKHLTKE